MIASLKTNSHSHLMDYRNQNRSYGIYKPAGPAKLLMRSVHHKLESKIESKIERQKLS